MSSYRIWVCDLLDTIKIKMTRKNLHFVPALVTLGLIGVSTLALADEMRVLNLPIPEGATEVTHMKRRGDVRCQVNSDFKTVGEFYAKKLAEQQWTKSKKDNLQRNFWIQTFSKNNASLEVRVDKEKGGCEVRLTPKGMMWEEDDQPTPKDLPLPAEATELEYEDFLESIEFKTPSNLKTVVKFLTEELEKRNWTKASTEYDLATFVRMTFTYQKSTLEIDVRAEETGCEVDIRTKGMNWDGMKAEIELAEKEKERAAEDEERNQTAAEMAASLQKRKEKHKKSTNKLPTLSNQGTVVMDGTTFKLPHVIAYEVYENDEWSTKIVATMKPVKQDTLLARLKKTGTDKDENEFPPDWPQPYLMVELEEDDTPWRLNLQADGTPGVGTGNELIGSALVVGGRARGTVGLKEPDSFFEKVYTAEITFDVPVLTRDSKPAKRLTNATKLTNSGKLTIRNKTYNLANVVAYEMKRFDERMTKIVFSEAPLNKAKLKTALGRKAADDYFEFTPQVQLLIDAEDNLSSIFIWADNQSVGGNDSLDADIVIEDGRARGIAKMTEPGELRDGRYSFEVSFDLDVMGKRISTPKKSTGGLVADSYDGLPVPEGHEGMHSQGSPFRKQTTTTVVAELSAVVDFYRSEMVSGEWGQWKENTAEAKVEQRTAKLAFTGPTGSLNVQLEANGKQAAITLVSRDSQAAKAAGLLPASGKARLFVANESARAAVITINKREYTIAAGAGANDPKTGFNWEVLPGNFTVEVKPAGGQVQSETLELGADETWGVIVNESGGYLTIQIY